MREIRTTANPSNTMNLVPSDLHLFIPLKQNTFHEKCRDKVLSVLNKAPWAM
jgi:hypothetical protein